MSSESAPLPAELDSLVASPASVAIPLYLCPIPDGLQGSQDAQGFKGYKVGISVSLTTPDGSQTSGPVLYEFDTAGKGFWASPRGTLTAPPIGPDTPPISNTYTSGISYDAVETSLNVSLLGFGGLELASTTATVALVTEYTRNGTKEEFPIYGHFYGDFGVSLQPAEAQTPGTPSLLTMLAQLPAPLNNGFVVYLNPYPKNLVSQQTLYGAVVVGLTDEIRSLFTTKFTMSEFGHWPDAASPIVAYNQDLIVGTPSIDGTGTGKPIGVIFDTGTPTTMLYDGTAFPTPFPEPAAGDAFKLVAEQNETTILSFQIGDRPGDNAVGFSNKHVQNDSGFTGSCNTGINPYFGHAIMYDLANGILGIRPFPAT